MKKVFSALAVMLAAASLLHAQPWRWHPASDAAPGEQPAPLPAGEPLEDRDVLVMPDEPSEPPVVPGPEIPVPEIAAPAPEVPAPKEAAPALPEAKPVPAVAMPASPQAGRFAPVPGSKDQVIMVPESGGQAPVSYGNAPEPARRWSLRSLFRRDDPPAATYAPMMPAPASVPAAPSSRFAEARGVQAQPVYGRPVQQAQPITSVVPGTPIWADEDLQPRAQPEPRRRLFGSFFSRFRSESQPTYVQPAR